MNQPAAGRLQPGVLSGKSNRFLVRLCVLTLLSAVLGGLGGWLYGQSTYRMYTAQASLPTIIIMDGASLLDLRNRVDIISVLWSSQFLEALEKKTKYSPKDGLTQLSSITKKNAKTAVLQSKGNSPQDALELLDFAIAYLYQLMLTEMEEAKESLQKDIEQLKARRDLLYNENLEVAAQSLPAGLDQRRRLERCLQADFKEISLDKVYLCMLVGHKLNNVAPLREKLLELDRLILVIENSLDSVSLPAPTPPHVVEEEMDLPLLRSSVFNGAGATAILGFLLGLLFLRRNDKNSASA